MVFAEQLVNTAGSRWQQAEQGAPGPLLPSNIFQFLLGDPEAFPGQLGYVIPPASSVSTLWSPTSWTLGLCCYSIIQNVQHFSGRVTAMTVSLS